MSREYHCIDCHTRIASRVAERCVACARKLHKYWNKGTHIKSNDALKKWRENGGQPWLKGKKGVVVGEKHWNWKGGVTSKNKYQRQLFRKQIQKQVFERDYYTCRLCCATGVALQVDHIQSWKEYVDLRFNIENCRTLCQECHYKITFGKPMPPTVRAWGQNFSQGGIE